MELYPSKKVGGNKKTIRLPTARLFLRDERERERARGGGGGEGEREQGASFLGKFIRKTSNSTSSYFT